MTTEERFENVIDWFTENMPIAQIELSYKNAYELTVAVILSAQCTDKRVNIITPAFFERFPDAETLAASSVDEIYEYIKSCSFPNNKAKSLSGMARTLISQFGGVVPDDPELLQKMPGVGRKSANVIANVIYNKPTLAVDTHVFRVSARIGLTRNAKNPLETEHQLLKHVPEKYLTKFHHWIILHGRYVCTARSPKCGQCGLKMSCLYYKKVTGKKVTK